MRVLLVLMLAAGAGAQTKAADPFPAWWKEFQAAVARRDAAAVARNARFPMQWENGPNRDIKTPADLASRFDFYFTPEIKGKIVPAETFMEVEKLLKEYRAAHAAKP